MWNGQQVFRGFAWITLLSCSVLSAQAEDPKILTRLRGLGLPTLDGKVTAYYSAGCREHAKKLQTAIEDMNNFYQSRLGVHLELPLALLNAEDWKRATGDDYSLPQVAGDPPVILMPATSDNPVYGLMAARKAAIPPEELQAFLKDHHTTFDAVAADFVDFIGFHELGHMLTTQFGIDPQDRWLGELLATYWAYAYVSERQPDWKSAFGLLGRPSTVRPKNTSLEDFERLYSDVDDYGWYQGMFELRVREVCPRLGVGFLRDLKQRLPLQPGTELKWKPLDARMKPAVLVQELDKITPGFREWAVGFRAAP